MVATYNFGSVYIYQCVSKGINVIVLTNGWTGRQKLKGWGMPQGNPI